MNSHTAAARTLSLAFVLAACTLAACDRGLAVPGTYVSDVSQPAMTVVRRQATPTAAYFGDEYAEVQRSLQAHPGEANAPTF